MSLGLLMKRREFIRLVAGAVIGALSATAALAQTPPVIGFLNSASVSGYGPMAAAFREGLKQTGFVPGENVQIEYRWANDAYDNLPQLAKELVERRVTVIFANSPSIPHAKNATSSIPIVFSSGDDPVRLGFVDSLNRPGGNLTGVAIMSNELAAKRLSILRDLVPNTRKVTVLINTDFGPSSRFKADVESAAKNLSIELSFLNTASDREIEDAFVSLNADRPDALLIGPGPFLDSRRILLISLAEKSKIPAGYETRASAEAGGLTSYGANVADAYRQAGTYVGRILKGEKPSEMPVMLATKVEFIVNNKAAKALNIPLNANLLSAADEVIE
jgi:putative tryptophan/tyrosine transport system substrate-binding protein